MKKYNFFNKRGKKHVISRNVLTFARKNRINRQQMKRIIQSLCMMLISSVALTSCLSDDDSSVATYSDTAITAVTLGTLNRYTRTTSATTGNDTIIKTTITGSTYKMTIDQIGHTIYNPDSLPIGTDLQHVTISTLTTKNSGVAFIKSLISDTLFYISTTDSLDFTQPRTIRVVATNGMDYRDYTMTLSASTTRGTTFGWQLVRRDDSLAGWADKHLVSFDDSVLLADHGTIVTDSPFLGGPALMRIGSDGYAEWASSPEATATWTKATDTEGDRPPVTQLIGATSNEIFALGSDGRLKVCTDGRGMTWADEQLDDTPSLLPTTAIAMTSWDYAPTDSTHYVFMAGNSDADDTNDACWRKLSRYHAAGQPTEGTWVYMPVDGYNRYALPRMEYLSLAYYNNIMLATGSDRRLLASRDQGITWKTSTTYALPAQMGGAKASIATDSRNRLWLVTDNGELWMGTLR